MDKFEFIPYGRQDVTEGDIEAVVKVLRSDFITQGPAVSVFEHNLCDYTKAKYAVAVNSCTSALHIACLALGLGPGDILWTSPITFVASANCALYCGATVDFVDIEPDTALMSVERLKERLEWAEKENKLPKIIIPVHFAGQPCDMKEIAALGKKYGFSIIEDAAHAIGARYKDEPVGNCRYSDITVFSFHPVKIITTGEGGAAMTNSSNLAEKMELLRSHGITRDPTKMHKNLDSCSYYEQIDLGFNYRMTDIQAALGSSQLTRLDQYVLRRNEIAHSYDEEFSSKVIKPLKSKLDRMSAYHLYVIRVDNNELNRNTIFDSLTKSGIGVNLHYIPVNRQPYFKNMSINTALSESNEYYNSAISLPIFPALTNSSLYKIIHDINSYCYDFK